MATSKAKRPLTLTSPLTKGADVTALQGSINKRRKARNLPPIGIDGEWGPETDSVAREIAYVLGIDTKPIVGPMSMYVQDLIHDPDQRNPTQLRRAERRRKALNQSADAVVRQALGHVGKTEKPAGSNRGPGIIDTCQKHMLGYAGYFWCGAFVGYFVETVGGVAISRRRIVYTPSIVADAKNRVNGFSGWHPSTQARVGDLALFDWTPSDGVVANHVELVVRNLGGGKLECVGGNTSKGGQDNNGGGIYRQERKGGLIGVARPRYAAG